MFMEKWKKEIWTIPNILSLFRIFLIPVYIFIYLSAQHPSDYYWSAGILAISCFTDMIDGKIARRFNMISTLGKILDPLADKATQFTLLLCFAAKYKFMWYLIAIFIAKEGFQAIAGSISLFRGKMLSGALFSGKLCTTVLFISFIVLIMFPTLKAETVYIISITDICFMLISFTNYLLAYFGNRHLFEQVDSLQND